MEISEMKFKNAYTERERERGGGAISWHLGFSCSNALQILIFFILHFCIFFSLNRFVYANKKLTPDQLRMLERLQDEVSYVCRSKLIPEDHPLYKVKI
jgi:hypothetical protein